MAGGGGTRLWPLSRKDKPKQSLPLIGEKTLFQTTVDRLLGLFSFERIFVVTVEEQANDLRSQVPEIPKENFLIEPSPKGTASVVGLAATILYARDPEAIMTVLPADHHIHNRDIFHHNLKVAQSVASLGYLVTLGITPTYPATEYGYIQVKDKLKEQFPYPIYKVQSFREKPDRETALSMVKAGNFYWNSGMFVWKAKRILGEFSVQMPSLYKGLLRIQDAVETKKIAPVVNEVWETLIPETIDYGIMENAQNTALVPATGLGWKDVGSWDALFDVFSSDENENIVVGNSHVLLNTHHSLVYGVDNKDRLVATIGVDNLIIVNTPDVVLVCHKDHAQKVREIVSYLKKTSNEDYL